MSQFDWAQPNPGMNFGLPSWPTGGNPVGPPSTTSGWGGLDFGQKFNVGMGVLGGIGNLWGAWQSNKLAKDQLNFTKKFANANLQNQMKSYNTALEDRSRSRAAAEGQTSAEAQAYVDRNRMTGK